MADDVSGESFTVFPKLPPEIRLKIWADVSCIPRHIPIHYVSMGIITMGVREEDELYDHFTPFRFVSPQAVSALLHTCRESREVGMKHYKLQFTTEWDCLSFTFSTPPQIYINGSCDRVGFQGTYIEGSDIAIWGCVGRYQIKRLSINIANIIDGENYVDGVRGIDLVGGFMYWYHENMEELQIYYDPVEINIGERFQFVDFELSQMKTTEGEKLLQAKMKLEKDIQIAHKYDKEFYDTCYAETVAQCEKNEEPIPEYEPMTKEPTVVKLVSFVRVPEQAAH
ncbi:hypothetical protein N431DRAFT_449406 [Stipitochalara longipes BDJ]|nr:hypothetical protein N431DRAFT_449406 [Stipitochalara longipes BDJ]